MIVTSWYWDSDRRIASLLASDSKAERDILGIYFIGYIYEGAVLLRYMGVFAQSAQRSDCAKQSNFIIIFCKSRREWRRVTEPGTLVGTCAVSKPIHFRLERCGYIVFPFWGISYTLLGPKSSAAPLRRTLIDQAPHVSMILSSSIAVPLCTAQPKLCLSLPI